MANFNFNKVIIGGRLTADPELKTTPAGISVTTFTIAVNRKYKTADNTADFFTVTAWRQTAEFITKYFTKGSSICVVGALQNRSWEKDGVKHTVTEIVADEASFVDGKEDKPFTASEPNAEPMQIDDTPHFQNISDDDELPF